MSVEARRAAFAVVRTKKLAVGRHAGETGTNENNRISLDEDEEGAVWLVSLNKAEIKKQLKAKNE